MRRVWEGRKSDQMPDALGHWPVPAAFKISHTTHGRLHAEHRWFTVQAPQESNPRVPAHPDYRLQE